MMNILPLPLPWPLSTLPRAACAGLCLVAGWELDAIGKGDNERLKRLLVRWASCGTGAAVQGLLPGRPGQSSVGSHGAVCSAAADLVSPLLGILFL